MRMRLSSSPNGLVPSTMLVLMWMVTGSALADDDSFLHDSRALAKSFGVQLKAALQTAIATGGPVEAIGVCKDQAPQIAAQLSRQSGARVGRTSRRFRNPGNAPEPWQIAMLEGFEAEMTAENPSPERIERHADGIRYMKAISMQPVCLVCHGEALSDDVSTALAEHYPHDRARGYALGDLRGAFSISWPAGFKRNQTSPQIK